MAIVQQAPMGRVVPLLAVKIDRLADLRGQLRKLTEDERALTAEIVNAMQTGGLKTLAGSQAVATISERTALVIDAELFHQAAGPRAWSAMTVRTEDARRLMGEDDLRAISERKTTPALTVKPIEAGK